MRRKAKVLRRLQAQEDCNLRDRENEGDLASYEDVVDAFIRDFREVAQHERQFFREIPLQQAIRFAALCLRPDGKRHSHQNRIPRAVLVEVERILQDVAEELRGVATFTELHALVEKKIGGLKGVGPLTVYDVASRIGWHLGLAPESVYLHAGTSKGARPILDIRGRRTISPAKLPAAFSRLRPDEAEDCLCIYKDHLTRIAGRG